MEILGKNELRWTIELARVGAGRVQTRDTWLDGRFGKDCDKKLLNEVDASKLDSKLCSYLDTIELDENSQFLRLSADYRGRPSWKVMKYLCQLANESESFYTCRVVLGAHASPFHISVQDQLLITVIRQGPDVVEIRSNVVPRQAFLAGMNATCRKHGLCMGGFSPISVLREAEPYRQSCTKCALTEQLRGGADIADAGLESLRDLEKDDVESVQSLGTGSQGAVYKILWRRGVFAKKLFNFKEDFLKEAEIATEVSHPNIVHCFGTATGDVDLRKSLFMEFLEESLETRLQEPIQEFCPFSYQDILDILWQVADAMKQLHEKDFLHGDLKPGNILLSRLAMPHSKSGRFYLVKVADFGCAQRIPPEGFADPLESNASPENLILFSPGGGTTRYTAPEVLRIRRSKDKTPPRHPKMIDVYSFGVVAYQVLTGVTELYKNVDGSERMINGIMQGELRPDSDFNGTLDRDRKSLLALVRRCWDPIPESRPPFSEICEELKNRSIEYGENGVHSSNPGGNAIFSCIGDVMAKLLKATITMCCNPNSTDTSTESA